MHITQARCPLAQESLLRRLTSRSIAVRDAGGAISDAACWHSWHDDVRRPHWRRCLLATCAQIAHPDHMHDVSMGRLQRLHIAQACQKCVKAGVARTVALIKLTPFCSRVPGVRAPSGCATHLRHCCRWLRPQMHRPPSQWPACAPSPASGTRPPCGWRLAASAEMRSDSPSAEVTEGGDTLPTT